MRRFIALTVLAGSLLGLAACNVPSSATASSQSEMHKADGAVSLIL